MAMQLGDLASLVEGRLNGNAEVPCTGANPPREATATEITMLDDPSRLDTLKDSLATAVVTRSEIDLNSIGLEAVQKKTGGSEFPLKDSEPLP